MILSTLYKGNKWRTLMLASNNFDVDLCSDVYELISFEDGMIIAINECCMLIQV